MTKEIIFTLPAEAVAEATEGLLLGDFNEWNIEDGITLKKQEDGSLLAVAKLEPGKTYQYRYLLNDGRWVNDYNAQHYVQASGFHVENCLITVPEVLDVAAKNIAPKAKAKVKKEKVLKVESIKDDLSKIEGIGKQVAALLVKNNISTFSGLSKTTVTALKEMLAAGGSKFKIHNPGTWPKQAKLAAAGKWEELNTLQTTLKAGK
ncbi:MAG: isoamylase early set domain-containing protein [Ferruginibacter sp.]